VTESLFDMPAPAPVVKAQPTPEPRPQRRSFIGEVEAAIRSNGAPYVAVDEAKRALFTATNLKTFHFVVYRPNGGNWLLWCGPVRKGTREDMAEWGRVFGEGFQVVYAHRVRHGIAYRDEHGAELVLKTAGGAA